MLFFYMYTVYMYFEQMHLQIPYDMVGLYLNM